MTRYDTMTATPPRLLFVSHHFPPDISIGSRRSHRIVSQMLARGWDVDVLCAKQMYQDGCDLSLMAGLEGANIVRTHALHPRAWARWTRDVARGGDGTNTRPAADTTATERAPGQASPLRRLVSKARAAVSDGVHRWVELPDQRIGWLLPAVATAVAFERPDVVLVTIPWATSALVGTAVAARFGVPLVLDYRDPWNASVRRTDMPPARRALEARLEAICLARATELTTVTPGLAREIGAQSGRALHVIPNASEPENFEGMTPRTFDRPTMLYAGGLYGGRTVTPLLESLARLQATGALDGHPLGLMVMGADNAQIARDAEALGIAALVDVLPRQTHATAMAATLGAAANLLLVAPQHKLQVPAKVFDHVAVGRPILALSPAGADVDLVLADHPAARCVRPEDGGAIDRALHDLAHGEWRGSKQIPEAYTVKATMDKLDEVLRAAARV